MEPTLTLYSIRINGHLGPTAPSAFPAMVSQRQGGQTVLTDLPVPAAPRPAPGS